MILKVFEDKSSLARAAATRAAAAIRGAIAEQGRARVIAATGASQFEFLEALTTMPGIDWKEVELFHLDEYIGLPANHPASFCKYLQERLIDKTGMRNVHLLDGRGDAAEVIRRTSEAISAAPIDIAFVGIGENGHLAFNDPPANFAVDDPYIIVNLDEACRLQQVGEGWFRDLTEVPAQAISMSIRQILKSREIICIAPDERKAKAVQACFEGEISVMAPASVLRGHEGVTVYLDGESARLLGEGTLRAFGG
ncbi:MAG: glucosamine-6-phosphate deaminase [Candidatus Acidiferrum sp.]